MKNNTEIRRLRYLAALCLALAAGGVAAAEQGKLLVWVNKDKCFDAWVGTAERYTKQTGVPVKVEATIPDFFHNAAAAGKGPDVVIWAHDILGRWVADGLLQPVVPSPRVRDAIDPQGWQAFSLGRKQWGYPIGIEAIHLIYNKRYVSAPPQSFDDVVALDKRLAAQNRKAILWDLSHIYYSWPLLAANGGYAFKSREDGWNANDVGVANAGAQKGANLLARLVKDGVLPNGASREEAESAFIEGKVAMTIDGPWVWDKLKDAGIDFGTAAIPRVGGKPGAPFVGVTGAMVSRASPNRKMAAEFIENALLTTTALKACNADKSLGVPADLRLRAELASDQHVRGMSEAARNGAPMPNNPEMTYFWAPMETALEGIVEGRKAPADLLGAAAKRIRER